MAFYQPIWREGEEERTKTKEKYPQLFFFVKDRN